MSDSPSSSAKSKPAFLSSTLPLILDTLVIFLSLGLIIFISIDTYKGVNYLENALYMRYQFIVCCLFLTEYFYRFAISRHKIRYMIFTLPFLIICVPYLNIINHFRIDVNPELLSYLCFIPIVRGLVALIMVVVFITKNIASTVFASYVLVLAPIVYMSGLIFYVAEKGVNPAVKSFWHALWWSGMNVTTIGCYINPMTNAGMVLGLVLSLLGIVMFPIFTVYLGDVIKMYTDKVKQIQK